MTAEEILSEIRDELRAANEAAQTTARQNAEMWTLADIGEYMALSVSSVRSRVITHKTFPTAVRLPISEKGQGQRLWLSKEVKAWILRHRETKH
ncbi:MAG: hypothetical protein CMF31_05265 [Kordiimonas sp.]|nr:hypothetical protein [Kordiimonas sp.]|tara:strand:- start:174 stop:455 length:282 start_codon:yes stop_codon:yes gene_type:complete